MGFASLTVDVASGRAHVLVGGDNGLYYFTKLAPDPWTMQKLSSTAVGSALLRQDQDRGTLLAAFTRGFSDTASSSVFAFAKP